MSVLRNIEFASQLTYAVSADLPSAGFITGLVSRSIRVKRNRAEAICYPSKLPCCYCPVVAHVNPKYPFASTTAGVIVTITQIPPCCHRSLGCCRLELSTAITCRRHLHFHTVSYYYKYLDVTIVVASNVVARNRTLRSFTNDVHLFIFRAKFQGATRCVGSYTVHILVDCHRLRFD